MVQDVSPFDPRPPRRRRRRSRAILGRAAALLAVLGLALGTWALGNSDGVVRPEEVTPPTVPASGPDGG